MKFVDRFKEHWFVSTLLLCAGVAAATWAVEYSVLVLPRDFEIQRLEREGKESRTQLQTKAAIPTIVLQRTWVSEGRSVTTDDGSCLISADSIGPYRANISVTVGREQARKFKDQTAGSRITVSIPSAVYYIDIQEILNDHQAAIEVTRQLTPESSPK
jgi:hypothetical protein